MKRSAETALLLFLAAALLAASIPSPCRAGEGDAKKGDGEAKREKKEKEEAKEEPFTVPIPVGHEAKGIKLPWFNEAGALEMNFSIGSAKRLDERQLEMRNLEIETYDEAGAPSVWIKLPRSVLDLTTRLLTADDEPVVSRSDFEITGDALVFDTKTREGRFTGKTRMLIYDGGSEFSGTKGKSE